MTGYSKHIMACLPQKTFIKIIKFIGFKKNINELLSKYDFFVLSSLKAQIIADAVEFIFIVLSLFVTKLRMKSCKEKKQGWTNWKKGYSWTLGVSKSISGPHIFRRSL